MEKDVEELDIPLFMQTKNYERERQERILDAQRQAEAEKCRRYKLQRQAKERKIKELKKRRARVIKLVLAGVTVIVMGTNLVTNLNFSKNDSNDVGVYEAITVEKSFEEIQPEIISINLSYEARQSSINPNNYFKVGSAVTSYVLNTLENSEAYNYFIKYGEMYGVDPYILIAKAFQESSFNHNSCLPGGKNYNGYGVGIMQHETPDGREIVAHNYLTGEDDVAYVTMENAINLEENIKMSAMHFQNCLKENNGNILLALQTYNYGSYMMNSILKDYAGLIGTSVDSVKNNIADIGWLSLVQEAHDNASRYISSWSGSYGDSNYISNVLRYFIGDRACYYCGDTRYIFDFNTLEATMVSDNINIIK